MFEKESNKIDKIDGVWNMLFLTKSSNYYDFTKWLIKKMVVENDSRCIYLTINRPYASLKEIEVEYAIDETKIQYLDAITKTIGGEFQQNTNCRFLESPTDLTGFAIGLTQAYNSLKDAKNVYFVLDTLSTLLVYNNPQSVIKFIHFINNKLKLMNMRGVLIAMENDLSEQMLATLSQFCDVVEEVGEK